MKPELLTALTAFAFVSSITPGPNNLMLLSSGANFGFKRSIPHMLGIGFGFVFMLIMVGLGLLQVFDAFPISYDILKIVSITYLLYLAWKIANTAPQTRNMTSTAKPLSFLQAASFQWVNPKAWTMGLTAMSVYSPERTLQSVFIVAAVFGVVNLPSISAWTVMGQQLQRFLTSHLRFRVFNGTMAGLLVLSLYPVIF